MGLRGGDAHGRLVPRSAEPSAARPRHLIPAWYHLCVAMTLRLPDDLDAKLSERARREGRSKQELAIEAIRDAQNRAELKVENVLAELMDSDAEILDYLK